MSDLRLVLLAAGALVLALIWLLGMRSERRAQRQRTILRRGEGRATRAPPEIPFPPPDNDGDPEPAPLPPMSPRPDATRVAATPAYVAVHVHAPAETHFHQDQIFAAAGAAGLDFDARGIFIMPGVGAGTAPLFSVANLHEPGTFTRDAGARDSRGLILILPLPVPDDPVMVLDLMLHTAELLAGQLGGTVLDAAHRPLDAPGVAALRRAVGGNLP